MARLAGLPPAVVARAREILSALEQDELARGGRPSLSGAAKPGEQLGLFSAPVPVDDELTRRLAAVDVDRLTPLDALAAFSLIEVVMRRTSETQGRVEASQRAAPRWTSMTRQLRSQVCLSSSVPPMAAADIKTACSSFNIDLSRPATRASSPSCTPSPTTRRAQMLTRARFDRHGTAPAIVYPTAATRARGADPGPRAAVLDAHLPLLRLQRGDPAAAGHRLTPPR